MNRNINGNPFIQNPWIPSGPGAAHMGDCFKQWEKTFSLLFPFDLSLDERVDVVDDEWGVSSCDIATFQMLTQLQTVCASKFTHHAFASIARL